MFAVIGNLQFKNVRGRTSFACLCETVWHSACLRYGMDMERGLAPSSFGSLSMSVGQCLGSAEVHKLWRRICYILNCVSV